MTVTKTANFSEKLVIRAGDLKHFITIQKRDQKPPTIGVDFREVYTDIVSVWSAIRNPGFLGSSQQIFSQTNRKESITHLFYIRFRTGITVGNWILFKNKRFNVIETKDIDFEEKFLELSCFAKGDVSEESSKW